MERTLLKLLIASAIFVSCGGANKTISSSSVRSIPSSFFNCYLGSKKATVSRVMDNKGFMFKYREWNGVDSYKTLPLGERRIKTKQTYYYVPYGGYTWKEVSFFFDYRDRFFCLAFFDLFSESEKGKERYDAVKSTLDEKYGLGRDIQYGVMYGNPEGKCISLVVLPLQDAGYTVCGLYYLDEKIYQTDTASAIDEL